MCPCIYLSFYLDKRTCTTKPQATCRDSAACFYELRWVFAPYLRICSTVSSNTTSKSPCWVVSSYLSYRSHGNYGLQHRDPASLALDFSFEPDVQTNFVLYCHSPVRRRSFIRSKGLTPTQQILERKHRSRKPSTFTQLSPRTWRVNLSKALREDLLG